MKARSRIPKTLKWTGAAFLGVLAILWTFCQCGWAYYIGDGYLVGLSDGQIDVGWLTGDPQRHSFSWDAFAYEPAFLVRPLFDRLMPEKAMGLVAGRLQDRRSFDEMAGVALPGSHKQVIPWYSFKDNKINYETRHSFVVPLWTFFVLGILPTAWFFWRDRPAPPGHCCVCRYDLSGSCAHLCPECGTPVPEWLAANAGR